jgi:DNA-binding MarR family transcriptional regulator
MVQHLPEWIMRRYSKLWSKFKEKEFTKDQAKKILPKDTSLAVLLSELRKSGWLEMKMSKEDARKTIYKLKSPEKAINEEIKELSEK